MSGTKEGAKLAQQTIRNKFGVDEQGRSLLAIKIGSAGGKVRSKKKGFGKSHEWAVEAGLRGAAKSIEVRKEKARLRREAEGL